MYAMKGARPREFHSGHYLHLARAVRETDDRDDQQRFEFGLACVLEASPPGPRVMAEMEGARNAR
jgi:hypothetical protein